MELSPEGSRFYLTKQTRNQKICGAGHPARGNDLKPFDLNHH